MIEEKERHARPAPELRIIKYAWDSVLQQRWIYSDGTCAGWREVPIMTMDEAESRDAILLERK